MKLKKVLSGVIAATMLATSSAIVMPLSASAAGDFITTTYKDITAEDGLSYDDLMKYDSLEFVYEPKAASECDHGTHNNTNPEHCIWCGVAIVGIVDSNGTNTSGTSVDWYDGVCYWWANDIKAATGADSDTCTASMSPAEIVNGIKSHTDWSDDYSITKIAWQAQDCTLVSAKAATITIDLPKNAYPFDNDSGTADIWGQPANSQVGEDKTITKEVLGRDFIIAVPYESESRPNIALTDGTGEGSTNWVQASAKVVKDGVAYFTKADLLSSWTAAGGQEDFTGLVNILVAATGKEITVTGVKLYAVDPASVAVDSITIKDSATTLNIEKGKSATLTATVLPANATDKTVTWSSSDDTIATVDEDGVVSAVAKGEVTITATAGTNKTATRKVKVTVPATGVKITSTTKSVLIGKPAKLSAALVPEDTTDETAITWDSSDKTVATIATDGTLTAIKAGTTTITAKAGTFTDEVEITVSAEAKPATAVTLNKTALDLEVEDTDTLTATLTPEDSTDDITWTSSAPAVATVDETGKVTAVAAGTATITATANATVKAECKVTVTAKTIAITGVTLNKTTATVEEGKTVELTATVEPADATEDKTVTWTSSDTTVATVKDGVVTAVKAGKATITATAGTKTADCAVTVTAAEKPEEPKDYETGKVETVSDYVPAEAPAAGTKTELMVNSISKADAAKYSHYDVTITVTLEDGTVKSATKQVYDCYAGFSYNNGDKVERAENGFFLLVKVKGVPESAKVEMSIKGIV